LKKYNKNIKNIIDIGTGGGLPAIPVAIQYNNFNIYAVDSIGKKIKFVELVKEKLQITNLFPICSRIEDLNKKEFFDVAMSRAVAELSTILEYSAPFVKINGYIVAYKAKLADEELLSVQNTLKLLNLKFLEKIDTIQENQNITEHCLLIFQKTKKTSLEYPRKNNLPRKKPLY
ncbi:16S rRNA (guanine(527)-N(7))-methyltransferase RsmG, partial [bacterium]|nr:16S rRNA (guanine(527)-N(7))-methyltransferase RsmG [bacterium]